jgi:twitching motility protein PilT
MKCDAIALRLIPIKIPQFTDINLPLVLTKLSQLQSGLVLVTGVTGSGKSTTLATIIDEINRNYKKHIITIEDPIEFIHMHNKSIVNQREVGVDVNSFSSATKEAMREDPDIILLGELRDLDTIANAITMAETGHLVFGTLHTRSVSDTVDRLIDVFPPNQQDQIRIQFANSIEVIICQALLPKIGGGRVPCCEIMFQTDAMKSLIKEHANPNAIIDQMLMESKKTGSQTVIQSLAWLITNKLITKENALRGLDESNIETLNHLLITQIEN